MFSDFTKFIAVPILCMSTLCADELQEMRKKALSGDAQAAISLGITYRDGKGVKRTKEEGVPPDRHSPPDRASHQNRIEILSPPMHQIDEHRRRPPRVVKIGGIADDDLLNIYDVGYKGNVQNEEAERNPICFAFGQRKRHKVPFLV